MSFAEKLKLLVERIPSADVLATEEATKNALVMPFIAALGYDVFNPMEVVPEFTADVGVKKGEKVDYAIKKGDEVVMLIETKKVTETLSVNHLSQLYRYFSVTHARIGVLTNGLVYRFFADLEEPNKMDKVPFLEFDLRELRDNQIAQLRKLTKESFDLEDMLTAASDLKYLRLIRQVLDAQVEDEPDEEFVRYFFSRTNPNGRFTKNAREQFTKLVRQALQQLISDKVSDRLRFALERESQPEDDHDAAAANEEEAEGGDAQAGSDVVTTDEEIEGYRIVQAIVCKAVALERVASRDTKSYFGVLLDDNNRKPICRLHFNRSKKYVGIFDANRKETRRPIDRPSDIYQFADELRDTVSRYLASESVDASLVDSSGKSQGA